MWLLSQSCDFQASFGSILIDKRRFRIWTLVLNDQNLPKNNARQRFFSTETTTCRSCTFPGGHTRRVQSPRESGLRLLQQGQLQGSLNGSQVSACSGDEVQGHSGGGVGVDQLGPRLHGDRRSAECLGLPQAMRAVGEADGRSASRSSGDR